MRSKQLLNIGAYFISLFAYGAYASPSLTYGVWLGASYIEDEGKSNIGDEAFIIYLDKNSNVYTPWNYSLEMRIGPGSFTDVQNNAHGNEYSVHKAWLSYQMDENHTLTLGKSQVPFGWETTNFWPGDMLLAAYGDQMDIGVKWQGQYDILDYTLAFYIQDDWSNRSTDTTDDNKHWGSSTTYRKVNTLVADTKFDVNKHHQFGFSYQSGELEEFITTTRNTDGKHSAYSIYWLGNWQQINIKASYISAERVLPRAYTDISDSPSNISNERIASELSYTHGHWQWLLDITCATQKNVDGNWQYSISPGVRYKYGAGWLYLEYLTQSAWFDRDMSLQKGEFSAWYLSADFYW